MSNSLLKLINEEELKIYLIINCQLLSLSPIHYIHYGNTGLWLFYCPGLFSHFHSILGFWAKGIIQGSLHLRQPEKLAIGSPLGQRTLETRPSSWASGSNLLTFQDKGKSIFLSLWYRQADGPAANKSSESPNWGFPLLGYKPTVSTGEHHSYSIAGLPW